MERALPPTLPTKEGEEPRYDFRDEGYRREAETAWRTARAMAVIYAYRIEPLLDGALGAAFETPTAPDGNLDALADAEGTPRVQPDVEPDGGGVHGAGVGLGLSE